MPRLHIPAGILRIPVFSVPIACFSQESQFWFRSNLVFPEEKGVKPSQYNGVLGTDLGVPCGTVLRLEVVKLVAATLLLSRVATRLNV